MKITKFGLLRSTTVITMSTIAKCMVDIADSFWAVKEKDAKVFSTSPGGWFMCDGVRPLPSSARMGLSKALEAALDAR